MHVTGASGGEGKLPASAAGERRSRALLSLDGGDIGGRASGMELPKGEGER
jgi:hypothetical protein